MWCVCVCAYMYIYIYIAYLYECIEMCGGLKLFELNTNHSHI